MDNSFHSAQVIEFFPCTNEKLAWLCEIMVLARDPQLSAFLRALTPHEQKPEFARELDGMNAALVERVPGSPIPRRTYGFCLALEVGGAK